jgi:uncharacterized membrane protein
MLKKNILTGLLVLIPIVLTLWVLVTLTQFLDQVLLFLPKEAQPDVFFGGAIPGYGVIVTLIVVFLTGVIANNFFGKKIITIYEYVLNKVPVISSIYKGIKQVSDTLLSNSGQAFSKAVLIEFPNAGTYTFAFVTGVPNDQIAKYLKGKFVNVYVPTTPNPTSGYTLIVPTKKIIEIDLSVDQVLKYVISMGVSTTDKEFIKNNKKKRK